MDAHNGLVSYYIKIEKQQNRLHQKKLILLDKRKEARTLKKLIESASHLKTITASEDASEDLACIDIQLTKDNTKTAMPAVGVDSAVIQYQHFVQEPTAEDQAPRRKSVDDGENKVDSGIMREQEENLTHILGRESAPLSTQVHFVIPTVVDAVNATEGLEVTNTVVSNKSVSSVRSNEENFGEGAIQSTPVMSPDDKSISPQESVIVEMKKLEDSTKSESSMSQKESKASGDEDTLVAESHVSKPASKSKSEVTIDLLDDDDDPIISKQVNGPGKISASFVAPARNVPPVSNRLNSSSQEQRPANQGLSASRKSLPEDSTKSSAGGIKRILPGGQMVVRDKSVVGKGREGSKQILPRGHMAAAAEGVNIVAGGSKVSPANQPAKQPGKIGRPPLQTRKPKSFAPPLKSIKVKASDIFDTSDDPSVMEILKREKAEKIVHQKRKIFENKKEFESPSKMQRSLDKEGIHSNPEAISKPLSQKIVTGNAKKGSKFVKGVHKMMQYTKKLGQRKRSRFPDCNDKEFESPAKRQRSFAKEGINLKRAIGVSKPEAPSTSLSQEIDPLQDSPDSIPMSPSLMISPVLPQKLANLEEDEIDDDVEMDSNEYVPNLDELLKLPERPADGSKTKDEILDELDRQIAERQRLHEEEMAIVEADIEAENQKRIQRKLRLKENAKIRNRLETELTETRLRSMFKDNLEYLKDIWSGKVESSRHQAYHKSIRTRHALYYTIITDPFTDDQLDWTLDEISKVWMSNRRDQLDNKEYVWKVLLAECFIKFYMDFFNLSKNEAMTRISETPLHKKDRLKEFMSKSDEDESEED